MGVFSRDSSRCQIAEKWINWRGDCPASLKRVPSMSSRCAGPSCDSSDCECLLPAEYTALSANIQL